MVFFVVTTRGMCFYFEHILFCSLLFIVFFRSFLIFIILICFLVFLFLGFLFSVKITTSCKEMLWDLQKKFKYGPLMYVACHVFSRNNSYLWPEATQGSHLSAKKLSLSLKWQGTTWKQKTKKVMKATLYQSKIDWNKINIWSWKTNKLSQKQHEFTAEV
jgi:hypothetical protein